MNIKYTCNVGGATVVLTKIISIGKSEKITRGNGRTFCRFGITTTGENEEVYIFSSNLEESLSERERLVSALEIMYQEQPK